MTSDNVFGVEVWVSEGTDPPGVFDFVMEPIASITAEDPSIQVAGFGDLLASFEEHDFSVTVMPGVIQNFFLIDPDLVQQVVGAIIHVVHQGAPVAKDLEEYAGAVLVVERIISEIKKHLGLRRIKPKRGGDSDKALQIARDVLKIRYEPSKAVGHLNDSYDGEGTWIFAFRAGKTFEVEVLYVGNGEYYVAYSGRPRHRVV